MKKNISFLLLAFSWVCLFQAQAQVQLTSDHGASGVFDVWKFHSVLSYDNTVINAENAKNMAGMFDNITFFQGDESKDEWNNVFLNFSGAVVTGRWIFDQGTLRLTNLESTDENGNGYIQFMEDYQITLDHTGVNDGKHFRLNFWHSSNGNKKPMYSLKFTKVL